MSFRRALIAAFVASATLLAAQTAFSATDVVLSGVSPEFARPFEAELRAAQRSWGRDGTLTITVEELRATVRFEPRDGPPIERTVTLDADPKAQRRALRWLAENVVRDEASELLQGLRPPSPPPPPPEQEAPQEPPPPPSPPPAVVDHADQAAREPPVIAGPCDAPSPYSPIAVTFVSPLAYPLAPPRTNVMLGGLYADTFALQGVGAAIALRVRCSADGVTASTAITVTESRVRGVMYSSGANVTRGEVHGVMGAPVNFSMGQIVGVQGGVINVATTGVSGLQGGVLNAGGVTEGAALGVINVAWGAESTGLQGGVINVARKIHGAQLGVINIAEDADAAVGIFSLSWARKIRVGGWASNLKPLQLGMTFEGKRVYSTVSFGRLADNVLSGNVNFGLEVGVHLYRNEELGFVWDASIGGDGDATLQHDLVDLAHWGTRVGYRLTPRLLPYAYMGNALLANAKTSQNSDVSAKVFFEAGGGVLF